MAATETQFTTRNFPSETAEGVSLIDFWAPWCGPCRMQAPVLEEVAEEMAGKAKVGKCNVDEERDLAMQFGVQSIPTLVILKDGQEVWRTMGLQRKEALVEALNSFL